MRTRIVLLVVVGLVGATGLGVTGVAMADPNLIFTGNPHRHFINGVEVGPRYCDNPALLGPFTQFHANTHTHNGVTGEIGPVAPGLHNGAGGELTFTGC
jgi:hypothetical protein